MSTIHPIRSTVRRAALPARAVVAVIAAAAAAVLAHPGGAPALGQGGPIVARAHLPLALRGPVPSGSLPTAPPAPSPSAMASPEPTATATAPRPKGVPACDHPRGDRGGLRFSLDGGRTLSAGAQRLANVAYTWAVQLDPRDPDRLLELHDGAVYASSDAGCTLARAGALPGLGGEPTGLTRAPSDPDVLVVHSIFGRTVAVSDDGGRRWQAEAVPDDVVDLAIAPDDPWRWTFVGREALWRRDGRDAKWDRRPIGDDDAGLGGGVHTAAAAPGQWGTWLVGGSDGIVRTADDGLTWDKVDAAMRDGGVGQPPQPIVAVVGTWLTFAPGDAAVAYAAVNQVARDPSQRGLWRSADGGRTWERRVVDDQRVPADGGGTLLAVITGGTRIFVSPHDPDDVAFAFGLTTDGYGTDLFRSTDGLTTLAAAHFDGFYEILAMAWGPPGSAVRFVGASSDIPSWAAGGDGVGPRSDVAGGRGVTQ